MACSRRKKYQIRCPAPAASLTFRAETELYEQASLGEHQSLTSFEAVGDRFFGESNCSREPFIWTKPADAIKATIAGRGTAPNEGEAATDKTLCRQRPQPRSRARYRREPAAPRRVREARAERASPASGGARKPGDVLRIRNRFEAPQTAPMSGYP